MKKNPGQVARDLLLANEAYREGRYEVALDTYLEAQAAGVDSADLWLNLGNTYYRLEQGGHAAWSWQRALRRDPGDRDARENLQLLRQEPPPLGARIAARVDLDVAAGLLLITWALACLALLARVAARGAWKRRILGVVAASSLALAALGGAATYMALDLRQRGWAVVLEEGEAKEGPYQEAADAFRLREASLVQVRKEEGRWVLVEAPGGASAWVPVGRIAKID